MYKGQSTVLARAIGSPENLGHLMLAKELPKLYNQRSPATCKTPSDLLFLLIRQPKPIFQGNQSMVRAVDDSDIEMKRARQKKGENEWIDSGDDERGGLAFPGKRCKPVTISTSLPSRGKNVR